MIGRSRRLRRYRAMMTVSRNAAVACSRSLRLASVEDGQIDAGGDHGELAVVAWIDGRAIGRVAVLLETLLTRAGDDLAGPVHGQPFARQPLRKVETLVQRRQHLVAQILGTAGQQLVQLLRAQRVAGEGERDAGTRFQQRAGQAAVAVMRRHAVG